jgi:hypothetical protein
MIKLFVKSLVGTFLKVDFPFTQRRNSSIKTIKCLLELQLKIGSRQFIIWATGAGF